MINPTNNELLNQINILRMRMIQIGLDKGLTNMETVNVSKQLDYLIYIYQEQKLVNQEQNLVNK
ncbi:aspartyl-phosphate phosphatase Spo0E family protein [Pseudoneobacillus sp. C159]